MQHSYKESLSSYMNIRQSRIQTKTNTRGKDGHCVIIKDQLIIKALQS